MRSLFVKCCQMFNMEKVLTKMDTKEVMQFQLKKYDIIYLNTPCKGRMNPFCIAFNHDDKTGEGIVVYWSRRTKYPNDQECDGIFILPDDQKVVKTISSDSYAEGTSKVFYYD